MSRKYNWTSPGGLPPTGEFATAPSVDSSPQLDGPSRMIRKTLKQEFISNDVTLFVFVAYTGDMSPDDIMSPDIISDIISDGMGNFRKSFEKSFWKQF